MPKQDDFFQEWRAAARRAHDFEQGVIRASMLALDGYGPPPTHAERDIAKKLRAAADDLFQMAMIEMERRIQAVKGSSAKLSPASE